LPKSLHMAGHTASSAGRAIPARCQDTASWHSARSPKREHDGRQFQAHDRRSRFPCRIKLAVPAQGLARGPIDAWLDENCGADGWAITASGMRGVVNDAVAVYFLDATLAAASVARWCAGSKAESSDGAFQVREDQPAPLAGCTKRRVPPPCKTGRGHARHPGQPRMVRPRLPERAIPSK
jgi:hypothetical protein